MQQFQQTIEEAWEDRTSLQPGSAPAKVGEAVSAALTELDEGRLRVAEKVNGEWITHQWLKKAVLLSFRLEDNQLIDGGPMRYFDKVPTKFARYDAKAFERGGFRVVPPATARRGAFIARNVVLMPSYVNIGAYVDEGTMVDTWSTVGSCAQIGKNVHLSGGVGEGSVISMGVYIGQSTKIFDRETGEVSYGRIPPGSVVVSGNLPATDGSYSLYCAVIVKKVDAKTRAKTSINDLLRGD